MPRGPSISQNTFDEYTKPPGGDVVAYLRSKVNSTPPTFEDEHLEFKGAADPRTSTPLSDENIKKIWSKALAGFATTSGGVLIWGIDAREGSTKVEQASGFNLVHDPDAFRTKLYKFMLQATDPPVPDVKIVPVPDPSEPGKGFVICHIPESSYKPHRALWADKRWVMRIGDNFEDIPTPVLRSLFFPHRQSYLYMTVEAKQRGPVPPEIEISFQIKLHNDGPASAENVVLMMSPKETTHLPRLDQASRWQNYGDWYEAHHRDILHPGQVAFINHLYFKVPTDNQGKPTGPQNGISTTIRIYARDQEPVSIKVEFTQPQLDAGHTETFQSTPSPSLRYS